MLNALRIRVADHPILTSLLIVWLAVGIFLAYRYGWRSSMSRLYKALAIVGFLLLWPIAFPIWLAVGTFRRVRRDGVSIGKALRSQLAPEVPTEVDEEDVGTTFIMFDTKGRSLSDDGGRKSNKASGLRLTSEILSQAVMQVASDVLIQPLDESYFSVRYRLNGTLATTRKLTDGEGKSIVNIIKAISGMNIAERRRPQDGAFTARTERGIISFRVATAGVLNGEKISVRILDQSAAEFKLTNIGLSTADQATVARAIKGGSGMILVCGPTGSGKSSTVHAMLRTIDRIERNVITIEDPIEYILPDASQIEINTKAGITFASVMRSTLRHDPDVISVGEIRDSETAEIALQAAQTGHLVFATVHSGSNLAALLRLVDLGVQPQLIASAVNVVISQRLVRRLCDHCRSPESFTDAQKADLWKQNIDPSCLFGPKGCEHCHGTGYSSRLGVFAIQIMDKKLREQWASGDITISEPVHSAGVAGTQLTTMQVRATQLAMSGIIPFEEVQRIASTIE